MDVSDYKNSRYSKNNNAADVVSLVDDLLNKAIQYGASDVHFEPTGADLAVKYRLDGVLNTVEKIPKSWD